MPEINVGQLSEAINDKADRNLQNVDTTAKADAVIDYQEPTADNGYTWYRKYASGWVEQGGLLGSAGTYAWRTITMPITMTDTNYTVVITGAWNDSSGNGSMLGNSKTTTTFNTYATNTNNEGSWYVCGMAAN
jgi:hypothetical protein